MKGRKSNFESSTILKKKIYKLETQAKLIKKIHWSLNIILSNSAYSSKEEKEQIKKLEKRSVPKDEIELIKDSWCSRRILVKDAMNTLREINKITLIIGDSDEE